MQGQILGIRDLGQHIFWQVLHQLAQQEAEKSLDIRMRLVLAPGAKKDEALERILATVAGDVEEVRLDKGQMNLAELADLADIWAKEREQDKEHVLHAALGFNTRELEVLAAGTGGAWLNLGGPQGDPCGALAEVALFQELRGELDTLRAAWLGRVDGLGHSLMDAAIYAPFELFMAVPPGGDPDHDSTGLALKAGAKIFLTRDPALALDGAHIIYMDANLRKNAHADQAPPTLQERIAGQNFSWGNGLSLTPELRARTQAEAVITSTRASAPCLEAQNSEGTTEKRLALRQRAFTVLLQVLFPIP